MEPNQTILIIEDSALLRSVASDALKEAGFHVIEASDGKEGLERAKRAHPALILLDLMMPVMDGVTMLKELRRDEWGKHVPVIILTATADDKISSWLDGEQLDFLLKDEWLIDEVVARVKSRLSGEPPLPTDQAPGDTPATPDA